MAAFTGTSASETHVFNPTENPVDLAGGIDTLVFGTTDANLSTITVTNTEILKAGLASNTTFTVDAADLVSGGSILGSSGTDTLIITGTNFDASSVTLSSVEILKAATNGATKFTVDQADLANGGSVVGSTASDTLLANGTQLNLSSTTLSSVEILQAGKSTATLFTVNSASNSDLASGGSVVGSSGNDTLATADAALDLRSTTLTSVEILKAGTNAATTFTVDQADLLSGGSVVGSSATDTLVINSATPDLTSTTLTSVEVLKAGTASATTFTVDQADLAAGGSVVGSSASDTLQAFGTQLNLTSTTLSSVEVLQAGNTAATTFTVDQADLLSNGSVNGNAGNDTLAANGAALDLSSTSLTSVEILKATKTATTFTVNSATNSDLASGGSVVGSTGNDTLATADTALDLRSTTLSSVEILKAGTGSATTFTVDQADLASGGSVVGSTGNDALVANGTTLNLASTSLTSVEVLKAGNAGATTFTVDQADLAASGQILGSTASDTLVANGTNLDLSSTFLSSIEILQATKAATTFTVNQSDVNSPSVSTLAQILGSSGNDTLVAADTQLDLRSTALSSVEILKAGTASDTTFTVDQADLATNGSVVGSTGTDTLAAAGTGLNLSSTTLSSVEILKATQSATTFTVDQADLASGGSVTGTVGNDTLVANGTSLNLSSTTLVSVDILQAGKSAATTFTVNQADLASGGSVVGSSGSDTLVTADAQLDLRSTTLSSIEILKAGTASATTFTVDQGDLASGGSVVGSTAVDTLAINGASLNLTSTTLSSVEVLKAGTTNTTTFTVDQADLASGGSVEGSTNTNDTLVINGTSLNLTSTTLSDVEVLQAGKSAATTFTVDQTDLASGGSVVGSSGNDTLAAAGTQLDLSSTTLSNVEILQATKAATTLTVNQADLLSGGSVLGSSGTDTLATADTKLDLSSTTVSSVEILKAGTGAATTFTVDQADLASGGSVVGGNASDTLVAHGTTLNLASTTLTSVDILQAGNAAATTFTVDQADLASGGSVLGSTGSDTLASNGTLLDLTSTTLSSIENLQATKAATTFIVNQADLHSTGQTVGTIFGSSGNDTLVAADTQLDLRSTALSSVEILKAGNAGATIFTVDQGDLASGGSVIGSTGSDILVTNSTTLNLGSTTLTSVEILQAGNAAATTFTVDQADLASGGSVLGSTGNDTLAANGSQLNLTSTTLSSVEILKAGSSAATTFTVDQADLASGGSVVGSSGNDTLLVGGVSVDLSSTTLSSVEILKATSSNATTFTVDQNDLASGGSVIGSTSNDTLVAHGTQLDLTSTTLSSVEILQAGNVAATTFTVDQADLGANGSILGSSGSDTLSTAASALNLTSTTLTSVEKLTTTNATGTTFTIDQTDLTGFGSIIGSAGSQDALVVLSTVIDLSAKIVTGIETLKAGLNIATTFTVDQADLATNGSVIGSSGSDVLVAAGTQLNLSSTTLTSIESLKAGNVAATTFTVDQADLASGGSVVGSSGSDTLAAAGTLLDLTSTTLTSIEKLATTNTTGTTFKLDATDFASVGSITGSTGSDTLIVTVTNFDLTGKSLTSIETLQAGVAGTTFTVDDPTAFSAINGTTGNDTLVSNTTAFDLSSTTLSSVEILKAGSTDTNGTIFTVDQADLAAGGSVIGEAGANDTLQAAGTQLNLSSTTLSSVEILQAGNVAATTFTVDQADLAAGGSVLGSSGNDILAAAGTGLNLTSTTLSNVEILQATKAATTFTIDQADLKSGGSVIGSTGNDTLLINGVSLDLSSTTLSSVEILKAGNVAATTFIVNNSDLASGGSVVGSSGNDTLATADTKLDLTSTTLSSVEILKAGNVAATTFTVDQADLANGGSVLGSSGNDTLLINGTSLNLSSTTLTSVEILQAGKSAATIFTVNGNVGVSDLASGGSVVGSSGNDTLATADTTLNLSSTTLSSVEILKAGNSAATTFTVDQADLASGGSVVGSTGNDTLAINGASLNLTSTTLTSVEILKAGTTNATTFTVDQADLASGGSVVGSTSTGDTLVINGTSLNLASTTLSGVEVLKAGLSIATTFTVDQADLAAGGTNSQVIGSTGNDTLVANGTQLDLSSTTLSSVEFLKAGNAAATTITVNQADLSSTGQTVSTVFGNGGSDTLATADTQLDLRSTTLSSIEKLAAANAAATTFTVDQADLASGGSVLGSTGSDTLIINGTNFNLASTTLSSVEILKTTVSGTTFTVDQADLASGGSVLGSGGNDTLAANGTQLDLSTTTLTSVETLKATKATTTFIVNGASGGDLASGGSVVGSSGNDTLATADTALDLRSTTLSSVEILKAANAAATTFTVDQADLATNGSVVGSTGSDTLAAAGTQLNLTSTTLSSVEILKATGAATTFTVDQADLANGGSVVGSGGNDALLINGTSLNLSSTTLSSVEILQAGKSAATTFTVNDADLASGGSVVGSSGNDTLVAADTQLHLSSTTLSSVEILKAGLSTATTFTVDQADLASGGSVVGSSGNDTLAAAGTQLDLTSTTLSSVEILQAGNASATKFTVDQADLVSGGSVLGSTASDTLVINGTSLNLTSTTLSSVEILQAGKSVATTFTVDQADLAAGGTSSQVVGSSGNDTLVANGTSLDLSSTFLSSIEFLQATKAATTFTVNQADLIGSSQTLSTIFGSTGNDTLAAADTQLNLTSTTLSSVEILKAGNAGATTFTVDQADLASGGSVLGSTASDTLTINGTSLNLASTTLSSVEILKAGTAAATTFTVDQADLAAGGTSSQVIGSSGSDILLAHGTQLDLSSTTLSSVEILQAGSSLATIFTLDQADLHSGAQTVTDIIGSSGMDTIFAAGTQLDLTSTTLSSIEILTGGNTNTTYTITGNQVDELAGGNGAITGGTGTHDTLVVHGDANFSHVAVTGIEEYIAANSLTFTFDQADLVSGGSVTASSAGDVVLIAAAGTSLDLTSTTLTNIDALESFHSDNTTFTLTGDQLAHIGTIQMAGNADTLVVSTTDFNLTSTSLDFVEILKAGNSGATTFTLDNNDLTDVTQIIGSSGSDTLIVKGNSIDLSSTTLSSVETIQTANSTASTTFTVSNGEGGSTLDLQVNNKSDTIDLAAAYKVTDTTSDATISAHTLTIDNFKDGATNGDTIDLSHIENGAPTSHLDITGYIQLVNPATLKDALNLAAAADGSTTSSVVSFQYAGDTYVLVDKSASTTLNANDAVIKLTGLHTLTDADNFSF